MTKFNRRNFLKASGATAMVGAAGGFTSILNSFSAKAADTSGYKALVCLFFRGGLDNHDTILPYDQASYDTYADVRSSMLNNYSSRARDQLLPLNPANASDYGGRQFALPPQMSDIHSLFESGNAAIVGNVGPLIQPLTRSDFETESIPTPKRLFSHNDQQSTWAALNPEGAQLGWGGKFADAVLNSGANGNETFTAISTAGNEVFLTGEQALQYQVDYFGAQEIEELSDPSLLGEDIGGMAESLIQEHFRGSGLQRSHLIERDIVDINELSIDTNGQFNDALEGAIPLETEFPETSVAWQLRTVAQTINIRDSFDMRRQVFFVAMGGFDTHSAQAQSVPSLQTDINDAVRAFYTALEEMGLENNVTLFTASDFGRTLSVNGDGTDHGWGAHHFVVGGAVNGNRIYGSIPVSELNHELDAGQGRLIPDTSVEQYAATLGRWFGLTEGELQSSLPNLGNFSTSNLGFL